MEELKDLLNYTIHLAQTEKDPDWKKLYEIETVDIEHEIQRRKKLRVLVTGVKV